MNTRCEIIRRDDLDQTEDRAYPLRFWECLACDRLFSEAHPTINPHCLEEDE